MNYQSLVGGIRVRFKAPLRNDVSFNITMTRVGGLAPEVPVLARTDLGRVVKLTGTNAHFTLLAGESQYEYVVNYDLKDQLDKQVNWPAYGEQYVEVHQSVDQNNPGDMVLYQDVTYRLMLKTNVFNKQANGFVQSDATEVDDFLYDWGYVSFCARLPDLLAKARRVNIAFVPHNKAIDPDADTGYIDLASMTKTITFRVKVDGSWSDVSNDNGYLIPARTEAIRVIANVNDLGNSRANYLDLNVNQAGWTNAQFIKAVLELSSVEVGLDAGTHFGIDTRFITDDVLIESDPF